MPNFSTKTRATMNRAARSTKAPVPSLAATSSSLTGVGTSVSRDRFGDIEPSWELETDPGIFEFGFILKEPIANFACARALIDAMIDDGLCESDESGPWLFATCPPSEPEPESSANAQDAFFRRRLVSWRPELRYPTDDLIAGLGIQPRLTGIRYAGGDPIDHHGRLAAQPRQLGALRVTHFLATDV
jgi:hypothetical protein